ncbi:hypothetical protein V5799_009815 [Amblyomma americanum]|uniref:Secreted protein n=1 Tax=Amblyomma americanum TaxID=6943 RepID=A0AAQ4FAJ1_AMBAM
MLKIFVFIFLLAVVVKGEDDIESPEKSDDVSGSQSGQRAVPRLHRPGANNSTFEEIPEVMERKGDLRSA